MTSEGSLMLANLGDLFIDISTSKNSLTNIRPVEVCSSLCVKVFSLTRFDCKRIKKITLGRNTHVETPYGFCGIVKDLNLSISHMITECLRVE